MNKIKIAIFDLTDCEGCELQFIALREELLKEGQELEIVNWRMGTSRQDEGPFDVTFVEGSPISEGDVETVKQARAKSKQIVTLGTCAVTGGVQAKIEAKVRTAEARQRGSRMPKPVSYYIPVDIELPGCPVNPAELKKLLISLHQGKKFTPAYYPVCLECKAAKNPCLYLEDGLCLGPVTKGGCGALCPTKGLRCYGCFGPLKGGNLAALPHSAKKEPKEIEKAVELFFSETEEIKDFKAKRK